MEDSDRLTQSRKHSASWANRASDSGRLRPQSGIGRVGGDEAAESELRVLGPLFPSNWTARPRARRAERPAGTGLKPQA